MQLDDLKQVWAAHGAALSRAIAINERLLRETMLDKVRSALAPFQIWRVVELVLGLVAIGFTGAVLARHAGEPRYLIAGGTALAYVIGITASSIALLVSARIDYSQPITAIQRAVLGLRRLEYRATLWALLGGVVVWLPLLLLLVEAVTGAPLLGRVDLAWLIANLGFGLVVLAAGLALSRRYVERELSPTGRRIVDALSGRASARASQQLAELATFERD